MNMSHESNARGQIPRAHVAAFLFYAVVAVVITWPLVTMLATHFAGYPDGDAHEMTRHIWWFTVALRQGQPLIWQPLMAYPDGLPGVILWSDPLQFFPAWLLALFLPLPAAYNLHVLIHLALNGWAAYFLVWKLTENIPTGAHSRAPLRRYAPALIGGLVFMTAPVMQGHLAGGHGGLVVQWPLPLLAYCLLRACGLVTRYQLPVTRKSSQQSAVSNQQRQKTIPSSQATTLSSLASRFFSLSTRYSVLSTVFLFLTPLGHTLQLIYAVMPLVGVIGVTLLWRRDWRALGRLILITVVGCLLLGLFLLPVFGATFGTSAYTEEGGGVTYSADLPGIVTPSFNHLLYGQWDYTHRVLGINIVEGSSYIGIVAGLLAAVAVWKNRAARWWLVLAVTAWILSLGPLLKVFNAPVTASVGGYETYITLPWALVQDLPGFNLARTPGRFGFVLALAVAVLAGYGAAAVSRQPSAAPEGVPFGHQPSAIGKVGTRRAVSLQYIATPILMLLILFDYQSFWPLPTYSAQIPQAVYDLAGRDDVRAVFNLPPDNVLAAKDALWLQTAHGKPMIAGQVTRRTPVSPAKLGLLGTLDPYLLNVAGADVVIVHKHYHAELSEIAYNTFGEAIYEDDDLALFNVPDAPQPEAIMQLAASSPEQIERYFYAPEAGWVEMQNLGRGIVSEGLPVTLWLDETALYEWMPNEQADFSLWLPVSEAGFHGVRLAPEPPCPQVHNSALRCPFFGYRQDEDGWTHLTDVQAATFQPVEFERGVTLAGSFIPPVDDRLRLALWWQFEREMSDQDVRFIKVLDATGEQIAGQDVSLGRHDSGSEWVETVILAENLPTGHYCVCVGWYTHPDLTRFGVLSEIAGSQDGLACVGEIAVELPAS